MIAPAFSRRRPSAFGYAATDTLLLGLSWIAVYIWRFGQFPLPSRGPLGLISTWLLIHYLLGTYTALARYQLDPARQLRNCLAAAVGVFALAAATTLLRGEMLDSTMSRGFLLPVLALGFASNQLLRLSQLTAHLWQPQKQWLLMASAAEREVLSRAIEVGGCAIPCGLEWRAVEAMPFLPEALPELIGLDGVAMSGQAEPSPMDRPTLLAWQERGVRLLTLQGWAEAFLMRLPPELVPDRWAERVEAFSHARTGPAARLKRLADLLISSALLLILWPTYRLACGLGLAPRLTHDCCGGRQGRPFQRLRFAGSGPHTALPQLVNVWRGEMSLVGPRPLVLPVLQALVARFPAADLRQWMRPGMTGWGRISGPPPEEPDAMAWELGRDLYYLRNHSLLLDLRLLLTSALQLLRF